MKRFPSFRKRKPLSAPNSAPVATLPHLPNEVRGSILHNIPLDGLVHAWTVLRLVNHFFKKEVEDYFKTAILKQTHVFISVSTYWPPTPIAAINPFYDSRCSLCLPAISLPSTFPLNHQPWPCNQRYKIHLLASRHRKPSNTGGFRSK